MELGSAEYNKIPLSLQEKNSFPHRNRTVSRRNIFLAVKLGIVRLIFLQNVVDGGQQHSGNGNNSFLVTSALLNGKIPIADFWIALNLKCAMNQQWLNVSACSGNSGSLFLPGTLIVLRRKPCSRA